MAQGGTTNKTKVTNPEEITDRTVRDLLAEILDVLEDIRDELEEGD